MDDIVEELRAAAKHPHNQHGPNEWLTRAANEIELLRNVNHIVSGINDVQAAKVAKLKAALKRWMQSGCPDCGGDCASAIPEVSSCIVRDTRAALNEEGGGL